MRRRRRPTTDQLSDNELKTQVDRSNVPRHIAVIMDGNGRWAKQRNLPRVEGHKASRQSIRDTVESCDDIGVEFLTLYTFSAENWNRPEHEVRALMALIEIALREEADGLHRRNAKVRLLGDSKPLPQSLIDEIARVEDLTARNSGITVQLAINYGGRQEIVHAATQLAADVAAGRVLLDNIDESFFTRYLYRPDSPDPDLLIRTGGDIRVSNYLLWQIAYAEIYVTEVLWPDFRKANLYQAVLDYQRRERRFGGVENVA